MNQHDKSSSTDVVDTPGKADEEDGRNMVNYLLLKVLKRRRHGEERHGRKCLKIYNRVCLSVCGKSSLKGN